MASRGGRAAPQVARAQPVGQRTIDGRFYRRRLRLQAESVAQHQRRRQEHRQRIGGARAGDVGRRAVHGLEQARARRRPSDALGSIPIEPVSIAASSLRMSPNMFSVTITSKCRGAATSCIAALSTSRCSSSTFGNSRACTSRTTSRHSRLVSSTLALSTLVTRERAAPNADPRDPLDLRARVDARVRGAVGGARLLAEVDPAGQLAHDQQVGALDQLALERARVVERRQRPHRSQVGEQPESLAQPQQALLGPRLERVGRVPLRARRRPPAAPRRPPAGRQRLVGQRDAVGVDRGARRTGAPRTRSSVPTARSTSSAGAMISGPMPSPPSNTILCAMTPGPY